MTLGEPPGLPSSQRRGQLQPIPNLPALPDRLGLSGAETGGWLLWCGAWDPRQALSGHSQGAKLGEGKQPRVEGGGQQDPGRNLAEQWGKGNCSPCERCPMGGAQGVLPSPFSAAQTGMPPSEPSVPPRAFWLTGDPGCFLPISELY